MKLGVSITAFREKNIVPIIKQYEGIADRIVVSVSKKPWYGSLKPDDTAERALTTDAVVVSRKWNTEADQRNDTMELLRDCDYVIVSHCDTWFTPYDLKELKKMHLEDTNYNCIVDTYWKDYETVIDPPIGLPTIIVRSDAEFTNLINIKDQLAEPVQLPITCHHVSWVLTDREVRDKISSYSHANEIQEGWFENVWKKWDDSMTDFGVTEAKDFHSVKKQSLPAIIRQRLLW